MERFFFGKEIGRTRALTLCVSLVCASVPAAEVPATLPRPGTTPPSAGKVKVYILAGQSNMVGMGEISGRSSRHQGFYLSADANAAQGVTVSVYRGKYSPDADYDKLKPELTETNVIGKDHEAVCFHPR